LACQRLTRLALDGIVPAVYRFEVFQRDDHQWYWEFVAPNGRVLAVSRETYPRREDALVAARVMKAEIPGSVVPENESAVISHAIDAQS
jgi:uncharacterized protein YegP (UPF0339 family)